MRVVLIVDGYAYGFFPSIDDATRWIALFYPVAFGQNNYRVYEFIELDLTDGGAK